MSSALVMKAFDHFLDLDVAKYAEGEWVAIYKDKVISQGKNLDDVVQKAEKIAPRAQTLFSKIKKTAKYL